MKKLFTILSLLGLVLAFVACSDDDDNDKKIIYGDLPTETQTFLNTYFGGSEGVVYVSKDNDSYDVVYSKYKVEFDLNGEWDSVDGTINKQQNEVPSGIVPSSILKYVAANHPNSIIVEIDKETWKDGKGYEIDLNNYEPDLLFDFEGNFLRED